MIPESCWGFVCIRNFRELDGKVVRICQQVGTQPLKLLELFATRLNLGPQIDPDGSLAVVFMPADSTASIGPNTLLVFPCRDVEALLGEFESQRLQKNLWKAELVWGATYVTEQGPFAVFGATEDAIRGVMKSRRSIEGRLSPHWLAGYRDQDVCVWVNAHELFTSSALTDWLAELDQSRSATTVFGTGSLFSFNSALVKQVDSVWATVDLNAARVKLSTDIRLQRGSPLAALLSCPPPTSGSWLALLPNQPVLFAAGGETAAKQMQTEAAELSKLLESETIRSASEPDKLARFSQKLVTLVSEIRGGALAVVPVAPSPVGLIAAVAVIEVQDAEGWSQALQQTVELFHEAFPSRESHFFFKGLAYEKNAEELEGLQIDHLMFELTQAPEADRDGGGVDFRQALGSAEQLVRIARMKDDRILIGWGKDFRQMAKVIAHYASRVSQPGLERDGGIRRVRQFLSPKHNMEIFCSPEEFVRLGRTLARMQHKVEKFPHRLEKVDAPIGATLTSDGSTAHLEVAIPIDLIAAWKKSFESRSPSNRSASLP